MARPTFDQLRNINSTGSGLAPETLWERILTCLAIIITRTNPDGTTF